MATAAGHLLSLMPARAPRRNATKHDLAGYGTVLAICRFMAWAHEQERFPTTDAVQARFGVCRATAYRWTLALAETYGLDPSTRNRPERPRTQRA